MTHSAAEDEGPESLPSFSEQVADQLGGVRGMVESSVPVIAFVLVNIIWSLKPALVVAVAVGLAIAGFRLSQRQSVRHAMNGLFGIAIGAFIAWRTGDPQDYYVPGILLSLGYGIAMIDPGAEDQWLQMTAFVIHDTMGGRQDDVVGDEGVAH